MTIRERTQAIERQILAPCATLSEQTAGRQKPEPECDIRTPFQRDRDRIVHCKAFRRLKHKTQVFLSPKGDHYRTRLTHTLEVSQIARTISAALLWNETLTEAISLGHDLGHTPFGHAGERALRELSPSGFHHNVQSVRVVERTEQGGAGLNLTAEVRDGILCHTGGKLASTPEGRVVRIADRIAYINHDIEDAIRAGVLRQEQLPKQALKVLGEKKSERIHKLICSVITHSADGNVQMAPDVQEAFDDLCTFMYREVYQGSKAKEWERKVPLLLEQLYVYFHDFDHLPPDMQNIAREDGLEQAVVDYISGMTDSFAISTFKELFLPKAWAL